MAKTAQLTWGLPLRLLKTTFIVLDPQFAKRSLSSSPLSSVGKMGSKKSVKQPCSQASVFCSPKRNRSIDDTELDFIPETPNLNPQLLKGHGKMSTAGGMRFIVYLVSLALTLAALSTLKLHKLLEWLTMDSDVSMKKKSDTRWQESQTKSSLISEIIQAASHRYSHFDGQNCYIGASNTSSHIQGQVFPAESSYSAPTSPVKSRFHSEFSDLKTKSQRRCHSESEIPVEPSAHPWIKPSLLNVEIRTQRVSGAAFWWLSVELSPPTSLFSDIAGLCLASANRICRLSLNIQPRSYSFCRRDISFSRSPVLVAHATPLTSTSPSTHATIKPPRLPHRHYSHCTEPQKPLSSALFYPVLEEFIQELETISFIEEPSAITIAPIILTPIRTHKLRMPRKPIVCRNCGVDTAISTRDFACSPIPFSEIVEDTSEVVEHSDADGLELDDEGVYFAYDYPDRVSYLDETDYEEIDDIEHSEASHKSEDISTEPEESQQKSEGFSNLVSLIKGISDDLLQLESGCQELIQRVHINRIELDRVNDNLSYVWNCKDADERMEKSWSSAYSSNILSNRYTPMGASFISTTSSCCVCNCHSSEKELNYQFNHESDMLYLPALSLDDEEYEETRDGKKYSPHQLSRTSSRRCLLPKFSSFQDNDLN